ncbi:MAG: hypothetical protein ACTSUS_04155 [Candidatus Freyarchaeota archaeon]
MPISGSFSFVRSHEYMKLKLIKRTSLLLALTLMITILSVTYMASDILCFYSGAKTRRERTIYPPREERWEILNVNGDVSLPLHESWKHWASHVMGFTNAITWKVLFSDKVTIILETNGGEAGHLAVGMWWTTGFKSGTKIPLYSSIPAKIRVDFDLIIKSLEYGSPDNWLRIALACAVQRADGSVIYTEMDFWDSPNTQRHPQGNIHSGGDIVYQGGNVVEYKIDQIPLGMWKHYQINLTDHINRAWKIMPGDQLESVYIVIEVIDNPVKVFMHVDNFWIKVSSTNVNF